MLPREYFSGKGIDARISTHLNLSVPSNSFYPRFSVRPKVKVTGSGRRQPISRVLYASLETIIECLCQEWIGPL